MDDENYPTLNTRTFYGLPKKKTVIFENLGELAISDDDHDSGTPSTSQVNNDDHNDSSEDELEDLLVEFENEADAPDIGGTQEECQLLEDDCEDEINLLQLRERIRKDAWVAQDNERGPATIPLFLDTSNINANVNSIIDIFFSLISDDMMDEIVYQTNLYSQRNGKQNINLTTKELHIFIGINLVMSYIRYPRVRLYWSSENGLRMDLIADAMPVNRYEEILRNLHFIENPVDGRRNTKINVSTKNTEDKLWKLRPFLNKLQANFISAMEPEEYQSVDEQVIPMKSKINIKQYLPKKPKKWGIKCWVRADTGGYMYRFEIYQGAKNRVAVSPLGACADVVLRLCEDLSHKNHKVFFDNLFCSIDLLDALRNNGIYGTGTLRSNRMQGAAKILPTDKIMKKEPRGTSYVATRKGITITKWYDKAPILVASACAGKEPQDKAKRYSKKENKTIEIDRPFAIKFYNKNMGGVDLHDQHLAMYPLRRKNKRWYIKVFMHFLDVAVINSYIIYKRNGCKDKDYLQFKASLAKTLINIGTLKKTHAGRPRSRSVTPPTILKKRIKRTSMEVRFDGQGHWPKLTTIKNANRCKSSICKRRTKYICKKCNEYLCPDCFEHFHTFVH